MIVSMLTSKMESLDDTHTSLLRIITRCVISQQCECENNSHHENANDDTYFTSPMQHDTHVNSINDSENHVDAKSMNLTIRPNSLLSNLDTIRLDDFDATLP